MSNAYEEELNRQEALRQVGNAIRTVYDPASSKSALLEALVTSRSSDVPPLVLRHSEYEERLSKEVSNLRRQLQDNEKTIQAEKKERQNIEKALEEYKATAELLVEKQRLSFILSHLREEAKDRLLSDSVFQDQFLKNKACESYVLSIDIRRSTDLMLKARKPNDFATFIAELCQGLESIILRHDGVFDKFTGDGILAFFPDFYSGEDAGFRAVAAANECHRLFKDTYERHRNGFITVLKEAGLGIGIDFGSTHLLSVGNGVTVVGTPVVYACRFGGAEAGTTLLNQPAYESIFGQFSAYCTFKETELPIKHEGPHIAYAVTLNGKEYTPKEPGWMKFGKEHAAEQ